MKLFPAAVLCLSSAVWLNAVGCRSVDAADPVRDVSVSDSQAAAAAEAVFLSGTRQLTLTGRRAGEGYFSADGRQMVFQSEREPDNPFFQIYRMDLTTGTVTRISPGYGKTTCAWIHPDGKRVLFASTHEDPQARIKQEQEIALRKAGQQRRYSWDYDEYFDIYEFDPDDGRFRNLTAARGYDAEGSWSPDGRLIAFASNRFGYQDELSDEDRAAFERDPSWACEICLMNADGSDVRRLTRQPGYDGGPFFSPDGRRICWRRFSEDGATAEIMTMNTDGSDQRALTDLKALSWAPYYHPSGAYLIFATNRHGFSNFELYLVDTAGKHDPVRVTHTPGFDGLPVFSPDGRRLAWTSNRGNIGGSQIFMADWNHRAALQALGLADGRPAADSPSRPLTGRLPNRRSEYAPADAVRHVEYLCRPRLEGRLTGTRGEKLATGYVALFFETLGLEPAGDDGSWFQVFDFTSGVSAGPDNRLTVNGQNRKPGTDWQPLAFSATGQTEEADVVFAGYGIQAPAGDGIDEYDSFVHLDVRDRWVLCFRFMPEDVSPAVRQHLARFSSLRFKAMKVRELGARGLLVVSGPTSAARHQLVPLRFDGSLAGSGLPVISISDALADEMLQSSGRRLEPLQRSLDDGSPAMGFPLKDVRVSAQIDIQKQKRQGRNVLGRLQIGDEPAHEVVVVGAHIDHLGRGMSASSLARDDEASDIHFGADDNASGVAAMLLMADALATARDEGRLAGHRDIIFAAWSGEELGLLGSSHYVRTLETQFLQHAADAAGTGGLEDGRQPVSGDESDAAAGAAGENSLSGPTTGGLHMFIAACLNMDMVGRLQERLILQGVGSSRDWPVILERVNAAAGLPFVLQNDSYLPTDASVFFLHGVPILSAFTGTHSEYHTPRDTPEKLNYEGIAQTAQLMGAVCRELIRQDRMPGYVAQARPDRGQPRAALRAWLGSIPDYAGSDVQGVLLSGVVRGGPCDQAGIRSGDVIIGLAGRKIENIYDYTYAIEALKIGQPVDIVIRRGTEELTLQVVPKSRD